MNENIKHIISRFRWDTSFDEKEKAADLQLRLSNWSKNKMEREINDVFDKVCPAGKALTIQSLELDLGIIDFNELESELTKRLTRKLNEKLFDLIHHSGNSGFEEIEILDENISRIRLLSVYLSQGVLPWNNNAEYNSVNQLLNFEWQHNSEHVIAMLRNIAVNNHAVRKRMATQFSEPNIIMIIHGLEPDNGSKIIDFANELAAIQVKKTVVKSGAGDFKRNIWFWVFNYLFTAQGSAFNRKAFLKSSIRQMADHYNMAYEELLELIEQSVEMLNEQAVVQGDFLQTLRILTQENVALKTETDEPGIKTDVNRWNLLNDYFLGQQLLKSDREIREFNELVLTLSHENKPRFRDLVLSTRIYETSRQDVFKKLNDHSIALIFSAWNVAGSGIVIACIHFIDNMNRVTGLDIERSKLWQIGAGFLAAHRDTSFNNSEFFNYCLSNLGSKGRVAKEIILQELLAATVPSSAKALPAAEIYNGLTNTFVSQTRENKETVYYNDLLNELIDAIINALSTGIVDKTRFTFLERSFLKSIQLNPAAVYRTFVNYPDKEKIQMLIDYLPVNAVADILADKLKDEELIPPVKQLLMKLKQEENTLDIALFIEQNLNTAVLKAMISRGNKNQSALLEAILAELYKQIHSSHLYKFNLFVNELLENKKLFSSSITEAVKNKILIQYHFSNASNAFNRLYELINTTQSSQLEVCKLLIIYFNADDFVQVRNRANDKRTAILNYLMDKGEQFMNSVISEYTDFLLHTLRSYNRNEISNLLNDLFWKCILNYHAHRGKRELLLQSFRTAIILSLPVEDLLLQADSGLNKSAGSNSTKQKVEKVFEKNTFLLIEACLEAAILKVKYGDSQFYLDVLMNEVLIADPVKLKSIFKKTKVTAQRLNVLRTVIDFSQFCFCFASDLDNANSNLVKELEHIHDIAYEQLPFTKANELQNDYWSRLWEITNSGSLPFIALKKLVSDAVSQLKVLPDKDQLSAGYENFDIDRNNNLHEEKREPSEKLFWVMQLGWLDDLCFSLINEAKLPTWYNEYPLLKNTNDLLNEILRYFPIEFLRGLKRQVIGESQIVSLSGALNFNILAAAIASTQNNRRSLLDLLIKLYEVLGKITIGSVSSKDIQYILFRKLLNAWISGNWRNITVQNMWNELAWELITKKKVSKEQFMMSIGKCRNLLPGSLQLSLDTLNTAQCDLLKEKVQQENKAINQLLRKQDKVIPARYGITVKNAGLVMVNSYITLLLERLGLSVSGKFISETAQADAVHYLQYIVTGFSNTEEFLLPLNKVLCGLALSCPVDNGIHIPEDHKQIIDGMIGAVIDHWPSIGDTSVNGFRGNWLVRNGLLTELEDKWELTVEKRAYDILMQHSPFSFSVIKYPWMEKPLHVNWPY